MKAPGSDAWKWVGEYDGLWKSPKFSIKGDVTVYTAQEFRDKLIAAGKNAPGPDGDIGGGR